MVGPKTAGALADVIADAMLKVKIASVPHDAQHSIDTTTAKLEMWETELAQRWGETFDHVLAAIDDDHPLAPMRDVIRSPGHQTDILLSAMAIIGIGVGGSFSAASGILESLRVKSLHQFADLPMGADVAVQGAVTRRIDPGKAAEYAAYSGIKGDTFTDWMNVMYSVPAFGALITMIQRQIIDQGTAAHALEQSGYTDDWIGRMLQLQQNPPSTEEALIAELEGYLDAGTVREIMRLNGDDPAAHDWRYESRGQPPPIGEMVRLWRRGFISDQQVFEALLEGPVKNKYIPAIMKFKEVLPSFRQVQNMAHVGLLSEPEAIDLLIQNGYSPALAGKMIAYATRERVTKEHDETKAEIVQSYMLRMIDHDTASSMLRSLGFTDRAVGAILDLADAKYHRRLLDEGIARVRAAYISWRITESDAAAKLDTLHVPTDMRDDLLHTWSIEHDLNRKHLTPAQIAGAWVRGMLTEDEAMSRLTGQGLTVEDAHIVLGLQAPKPKAQATP